MYNLSIYSYFNRRHHRHHHPPTPNHPSQCTYTPNKQSECHKTKQKPYSIAKRGLALIALAAVLLLLAMVTGTTDGRFERIRSVAVNATDYGVDGFGFHHVAALAD